MEVPAGEGLQTAVFSVPRRARPRRAPARSLVAVCNYTRYVPPRTPPDLPLCLSFLPPSPALQARLVPMPGYVLFGQLVHVSASFHTLVGFFPGQQRTECHTPERVGILVCSCTSIDGMSHVPFILIEVGCSAL